MASSANQVRVVPLLKSKLFNNRHLAKHQIYTTCVKTAMPNIAPDHVYLDKPQYPEIRDPSELGRKRHSRLDRYDEIKRLPTVMDKTLCFLNERCYYYLFEGFVNRYGAMEYIQHTTKTHLIQGLPESYNSLNTDAWVKLLREPFLDAIACESSKVSWKFPLLKKRTGNEIAPNPLKSISGAMLQFFSGALTPACDHLLDSHITEDPWCDVFWWRGNDMSDPNIENKMKKIKHVPRFQLRWRPDYLMRTKNPLSPIFDRNDPLCASNDVPYCPYHPNAFRPRTEQRKYNLWSPGFWPGDTCEFPFLTITSPTFLEHWKAIYGPIDTTESLDTAALVCMYGWLLSSAMMQGFTSFNELTYPFVGQLIFTDGKVWTFYTYQLNTVCLHPDVDNKTHRNLCWTSGPLNLYETIENGELKGVNEEVLGNLIKFFLTPTPKPVGLNLKPYINQDSVSHEEQRDKLRRMKDLMTNKIGTKFYVDEIPTWHHVYKYNKKAPLSPRVKLW